MKKINNLIKPLNFSEDLIIQSNRALLYKYLLNENQSPKTIKMILNKKFKDKYETQKEELQSKIENPTLNSSNLEWAIDKALSLSESLEKIWVNGNLKQRQKLQNLVFPSGLGYDKSNDRVRTPKVNAIFGSIPILTKEISNIKNGEPIPVNQFSDLVTSEGFKPPPF